MDIMAINIRETATKSFRVNIYELYRTCRVEYVWDRPWLTRDGEIISEERSVSDLSLLTIEQVMPIRDRDVAQGERLIRKWRNKK